MVLQIAESEIAYLLSSNVTPAGLTVETYMIREPDMTPITQVQIFTVFSVWIAWTGNLTRAENQARAKRVAEMRNRE